MDILHKKVEVSLKTTIFALTNLIKINIEYFKENDQFFKFTKHVSTELSSSSVEWFTKQIILD